MRTTADRIRHSILFELGMVVLFSPIISILFKKDIATTGALTICLSLIAMVVNYLYNLVFDHFLVRLGKHQAPRTICLRMVHAFFFELSLLAFALPIIAFALEISLLDAFLMDMGFALFALIYAYIFNWTYDRFFPVSMYDPVEKGEK